MFSNFQKKFTFVFRLQEPWNSGTLEPWNPADLEPWTGEPTWGAYLGSLLGEPTYLCAQYEITSLSAELQDGRSCRAELRTYHDGTLMISARTPVSSKPILPPTWSTLSADSGSLWVRSPAKPQGSLSQRPTWTESAPIWADLEHAGR